jgi:hypothetical protein
MHCPLSLRQIEVPWEPSTRSSFRRELSHSPARTFG